MMLTCDSGHNAPSLDQPPVPFQYEALSRLSVHMYLFLISPTASHAAETRAMGKINNNIIK
jgi:hypothetical protein